MLKALLAFIPLLAGYLFVTRWHESRYLIRRQSSQGVYFFAALAGIVLVFCSIVALELIGDHLAPARRLIEVWAKPHLPFDEFQNSDAASYWLTALTFTLVAGATGSYVLNFLQALMSMRTQDYLLLIGSGVEEGRVSPCYYAREIYKHSTHQPLRRAINRMNADFEVILLRALELGKPVSFTLHGGKVYVGWLSGAIDPTDSRDMIRMLPLMSGYRKEVTHKITFTTFYHKIYEQIENQSGLTHLTPENFEMAFSFADVQSVNLFDIMAYVEFQKGGYDSRQGSLAFNDASR
nr:hypothetical protein BN993_03620 [Virgibacillus halodenitrificans]